MKQKTAIILLVALTFVGGIGIGLSFSDEDLTKIVDLGVNVEPKVWGQGDPDPNHIKYFGNGNLSRLCYVQTQAINRQGQLIRELAALNSKQHLRMGKSIIELFDRIRKLEGPNGPKENKTPDKPH